MPAEPLSWWELRDLCRRAADEGHGRATRRVAFEIPIAPERFDKYFEISERLVEVESFDMVDYVDAQLVAEVREVAESPVEIVEADVGRGASGYGAAIELVEWIATVGGAAAAITMGASAVRKAYQRIADLLGHKPAVSIGAATFLAAADLIDRIGPGFELIGAHDAAEAPPDMSYTGEDQFVVLFGQGLEIITYIVESDGTTHYVGTVTRNETPFERAMREVEDEGE